MRAEAIIKALLEAATGVTALVGSRLYALARPEGDALPAVVWSVISDMPRPPFDATPGSEPCSARLQVNCLGSSAAATKALAEQVRLACHLKSGTIAGITVIAVLQDVAGPDSYDPLVDTYQQAVDFIVHYLR
jgi:hypothetical protein